MLSFKVKPVNLRNPLENKSINNLGRTPLQSLFSGFGLLVGCFLFSNFLVVALAGFSGLGNAGEIFSGHATDSYSLNFLRLTQGITILITFAFSSLLWANFEGKPISAALGFGDFHGKNLILSSGAILIALPFVTLIYLNPDQLALFGEGIKKWVDWDAKNENTLKLLIGDLSVKAIFLNFFVISVIPAFSEELFFRGFLLKTLNRMMGTHLAIWVSAFLFSALHFQVLGFFSRLALGGLLGYLAIRGKNLWLAIAAHFIHNFLQLILVWWALFSGEKKVAELSEANVNVPVWLALLSLIGTIGLILAIRKKEDE